VQTDVRNLRHPIRVTIDDETVELVTSGYLAAAVGRTPRTIRNWRALNLLPPAPFVLHFKSFSRRRWLYPLDFVDAVAEIAAVCEIGRRMRRDRWLQWEQMVDEAEEQFISPLLGSGVTGPIHLRSLHRGSAGLPKH